MGDSCMGTEPPAGGHAFEWLVVTTGRVSCEEDAWERIPGDTWNWLVEDFHTVLKTGCGIEVRRTQTAGAMWNLFGLVTPMAMRLLWLRQTAQQAAETPATAVVSAAVLSVVPTLERRPGVARTARDVWRTIASFGGSFNRKHDGPPGWQTFWKGWLSMQTVLLGVHLATRFPPPYMVLTCQWYTFQAHAHVVWCLDQARRRTRERSRSQ